MSNINDIPDINRWSLSRADPIKVIEYIEISEVMRGDISIYQRGAEPSRAKRRLKHGDTVISTVRPNRGSRFLSLNPSDSLIASTGFAVLTSRDNNWAFLYSLMTRPEVAEVLGRLSDGGAYPAIRPEIVGDMPIVIPDTTSSCISYQALAGPIFERMECNRKESRILAKIRDTLLPRLISGKLRIPDAERLLSPHL